MKEKQNQAIWLKKLKREIKDALKDLKHYHRALLCETPEGRPRAVDGPRGIFLCSALCRTLW